MTDVTTIRIPSTIRGYTVIPNGLLPEGKISARAWGIYVYLRSRPPGWECRTGHLGQVFREGRDAIYTALRELVDVDLMIREKHRVNGGPPRLRFALVDEPPERADFQYPGNPGTDFPDPDFPGPENPIGVTKERTTSKERAVTTEEPFMSGRSATDPAPGSSLAIVDTPREDVDRLCAHLADRIQENGSNRPTVGKTWHTAARLLLDVDGRSEAEAHQAIDWCQADEFWRGNILSMPKLRQKYDQLKLQAQRKHSSSTSRNGQFQEQQERAMARAEERERQTGIR